jgi:hypothetical protein
MAYTSADDPLILFPRLLLEGLSWKFEICSLYLLKIWIPVIVSHVENLHM